MKKSEVQNLIKNIDYKYSVEITNQFKKGFVLCVERGLDKQLLINTIKILARDGNLPPEYNAHPLKGYKRKENEKVMECHIQPDWLLIWVQNDKVLVLLLIDTGTHSDLFGT